MNSSSFLNYCIVIVIVMTMMVSSLSSSTAFTIDRRTCPDTARIRVETVPSRFIIALRDASSPDGDMAPNEENHDEPDVGTSPPAMTSFDDGGSDDLTDRFKYKVNALMGVFDPQTGVDDEFQDGNILNAMLKFPVRYSFHVVGKTKGRDDLKQEYIDQVKEIVGSLSGDGDRMECRITPRGENFTRVTMQVTVDSVAVINSIYDALDDTELTVMRY